MSKNSSQKGINYLYGIIITIALISTLVVVTYFIFTNTENKKTIADPSSLSFQKQIDLPGEVLGVNDDKTTKIQINSYTDSKIVLQIINNSLEPIFFTPEDQVTISNSKNEKLIFTSPESPIVVLSKEAKDIILLGNFDTATGAKVNIPGQVDTNLKIR
jgi:hypothetical protein